MNPWLHKDSFPVTSFRLVKNQNQAHKKTKAQMPSKTTKTAKDLTTQQEQQQQEKSACLLITCL